MKVLTFYLWNNLMGIDVTLVKEINRNVDYSVIPGAKPYIIGLMNMRGQVVTLFDLAKLIHMEMDQPQAGNTCIVLKKPKDPDQVGFIIDQPGDVIDICLEDTEAPPANVSGIEGEYIESIVKLERELLMVIDPNKLFGEAGGI